MRPVDAGRVVRLLVTMVSLAGAAVCAAQSLVAVPPLTERVTDTSGLLTPEQRASLESSLALYEQQRGSQIAVLTVPSTAPEAIEQYGIRVAEAWKLGRKGTADGVIVIVAKDNPRDLRRLRIEVGRGVEGAITDAQSKRIIDEYVAPRFREGDYYGGLVAGIDRIEALLAGESLPAPPAASSGSGGGNAGVVGIGLPGLFLLFVIVAFLLRGGRSRQVGYLSGNRALNQSVTPFVIGSILGSLGGRGGGGGGSGGGGGFSGGGGDFGGGGASGDW